MIKRLIKKIKSIWEKFIVYLFGKQPTREEIFLALYEYIKKNYPLELAQTCHCGNFLNHKNIDIQFNNSFVWVIFQCEKCNQNLERRYDYEWNLLKD